jgi:hypothetical protein
MALAKLGRLWQFIGVAIATHFATRHAMVWGDAVSEVDPRISASWIQLLIGMSVAVIFFWSGVYLEGRQSKASRKE